MFADKIARMRANNWTGCIMTIKELEQIQETFDALNAHIETKQNLARLALHALLNNDRKLACKYLRRITGGEQNAE